MPREFAPAALALAAAVSSFACGGVAPLTSPTPASPTALSISVQALVVGMGHNGASGEGIALSLWAGSPLTASSRLELGFADGSASVDIPFEPASIRLGANARGTLSASVPDPADPRLGGRTPTSFRAAVTVRDDVGGERTVFVNLSVPVR